MSVVVFEVLVDIMVGLYLNDNDQYHIVGSAESGVVKKIFPQMAVLLITSPNSSDTTALPISTTFDPLYSFYIGSYDDVITQWLYTSERTIQFQGTYVTGLSSAPSWLSFSDDFKFLYATNEYLNRVQV